MKAWWRGLPAIGPWGQVCLALAAIKALAGLGGFLLEPRHFVDPSLDSFPPGVFFLLVLSFSAVAGWLLFQGRGDRRAVHLGAVFLLVASSFSNALMGQFAVLRSDTLLRTASVLNHLSADAFLPYFFWLFVRGFPRSEAFVWRDRFVRIALRVSVSAGALLFLLKAAALFLPKNANAAIAGKFQAFLSIAGKSVVFWGVVITLALPALGWMLWKARSAGSVEQRRARLFVTALAIGFGPLMVAVLAESLFPAYRELLKNPSKKLLIGCVLYPLLLSIPVATAYSVVVHHVLDVRTLVRKTLQYALARYSVLAIAVFPLTLLVLHAYEHRDDPLALILSGPRSLALMSATTAGVALLLFRRRVFGVLDQRFFRDQYDSRKILAKLAESCRTAGSVEKLVSFLSIEIDKAMHLASLTVFIIDPTTACFTSLDRSVRPLSASAALAQLMENSTEPLEVDLEDPASTLFRLPEEDRQWLADGGYRLLVPLPASDGSLLGIIALGDKRSELPFSGEDRLLLSAIAAAGSLTLENRLMRGSHFPAASRQDQGATAAGTASRPCADDAAMECPSCRKLFPPGSRSCAACGGGLETASVPHLLLGKFRLDKRIGSGGMGVVYRAVDLTLGRTVAIKTLPRVSPEFSSRLRREARAMASTWHPNLALIFGAESWRGVPMLIFEFLSGGTLADRLKSAPLSLQQAVHLGIVMADVLERTHSAGILHRDIKPSNIGYNAEGIPKLLDFGLAHILYDFRKEGPHSSAGKPDLSSLPTVSMSGSTSFMHRGRLAGTPAYLSPEAVNGRLPDPSFDLWSTNIMLYEAIAGKRPMERATLAETLQCVSRGIVPDIRQEAPSCPECLAQFFRQALARNPSRRPRTARDLRSRLEQLEQSLAAAA